jgi:hypothetical protein
MFRFLADGVGGSTRGSEETVSPLGNGLNVPRILGIIPQGLPQFANRDAKAAVKVDKRVSLPDAILDLLPADYTPRIFQKYDQQAEGLLL